MHRYRLRPQNWRGASAEIGEVGWLPSLRPRPFPILLTQIIPMYLFATPVENVLLHAAASDAVWKPPLNATHRHRLIF